MYTVSAIGLLIVLVASINFVNLLTGSGCACAPRGRVKALGAQRSDLFKQFMTESFLYVGVGAAAGLGLASLALKPLNLFCKATDRPVDVRRSPLVAGALAFLALVAFLAGSIPRSCCRRIARRPSRAAVAWAQGRRGCARCSSVLQFAILIALLVSTVVTYRQMQLGMREALRQSTDPILLVRGCNETLEAEMLRARGVVAAACSMGAPQWGFQLGTAIKRGDREATPMRYLPLDFGFFELFGMKLAAGRYSGTEPRHGGDAADNVWKVPEAIVVNQTAARAASPALEAIGADRHVLTSVSPARDVHARA